MKSYFLKSGGWYQLSPEKGRIKYALHCGYKVLRVLLYSCTMLLTFLITFTAFERCIQTKDLNETIALGAVFATFGSAAISVFSLYCNMESNKFQSNLIALQNQLLNQETWERWEFLKRIERKRISHNQVQYYILKNPQIDFQTHNKQITVTFPASLSDFKEIFFIKDFFKMRLFRHKYYLYIYNNSDAEQGNALLIYNCVYNIYKNMLCYKIDSLFIWLGSCFILFSVIFSFTYYRIIEIIAKLSSDFYGIIFAVMAFRTEL